MRALIAVLLMAVVTYLPRVVPIAMVKGKLKSKWLKSFLYYIPFAVLGAMTFPSIIYATGNIYTALIGMVVALILAYFEKSLMMVAICSVFVVYICGIIL